MDTPMTAGTKAGLLPFMDWLLAGPLWQQELMGLAILFVPIGVATLLIEQRVPKLRRQYLGFLPGDLFLAVAWILAVLALNMAPPQTYGWWQDKLVTYIIAGVAVLGCTAMAVVEFTFAYRNYGARRQPRPPRAYTPYQLWTPSNMAHRVSQFVLALGLLQVIIAGMWVAPSPWLSAGVLAFFCCWASCVAADNFVDRNIDTNDIHPKANAWFPAFRRWARVLVGK